MVFRSQTRYFSTPFNSFSCLDAFCFARLLQFVLNRDFAFLFSNLVLFVFSFLWGIRENYLYIWIPCEKTKRMMYISCVFVVVWGGSGDWRRRRRTRAHRRRRLHRGSSSSPSLNPGRLFLRLDLVRSFWDYNGTVRSHLNEIWRRWRCPVRCTLVSRRIGIFFGWPVGFWRGLHAWTGLLAQNHFLHPLCFYFPSSFTPHSDYDSSDFF